MKKDLFDNNKTIEDFLRDKEAILISQQTNYHYPYRVNDRGMSLIQKFQYREKDTIIYITIEKVAY
jgi:hypothetical protein